MAEFKKKNKYSFWFSPIVLVILLILLGFLVYSVAGLIKKEKETAVKKENVLDKIDSLETREESLTQDIHKLETEEGIEDTIREKYQVVKEGEKMVVIVDEEKPTPEINSTKEHGFWNWLKNVFSSK